VVGRVCSPGGKVAKPSRLRPGHDQRQDAAATLPAAHGGAASGPPSEGTWPTAWAKAHENIGPTDTSPGIKKIGSCVCLVGLVLA
jgi:hypothetical protein